MSYLLPIYNRSELDFVRGQGCWLYTQDESAYLDFAAGIAVNSLGHSHPKLVAALSEQGQKLWHVSNLYSTQKAEDYARALMEGTPFTKAFFCNSGAEANEAAIKFARRYHHAKGNPQKWRVITANNAFHGRTLATISATGNKKVLDGFGPAVDGFDHVPFLNSNVLKSSISSEIAAILIEPVQGEGGIITADKAYLQALRAICDEYDLLLIYDEIQCGMGRSGRRFAAQHFEVMPDIISLAKGIAGGFPMGAVLSNEKASAAMTAGTHGTTYGGNPLAIAVASAVLDCLSDDFLAQVREKAQYLQAGLEALAAEQPAIKTVRGLGLMQGIVLNEPYDAGRFVQALRANKLLTVPAGQNTLRLLPPLIVTKEEIDLALSILKKTFQGTEA